MPSFLASKSPFKYLPIAAFLAFSVFISNANAAIPEPKSGGKYALAKGTKADEVYEEEGRAGGPGYEWQGKGLEVGAFVLRPFIQYKGVYEDNIFYSDTDTKDDYISQLAAGVDAELPLAGGQHLLTGTFREDIEWFAQNDSQDHNDYTLGAGLDLNFVPFSLNLEDTHSSTVDRADTEFTSRVAREVNLARGLLEIPFASFFLETEVMNQNFDYRAPENQAFNHNDFVIYQRLGLDVAPSTQFLLEYGYENIDYSNLEERNGDGNQMMAGLRGVLSERITYQAWGGAQWRVYDSDIRPDFNGFVSRVAVQYDINETSNIVVRFNRDPQESTFDNQSFYVRNKLGLIWTQQIAERVYLKTDGAYSHNDYSRITVLPNQDTTRRDDVWDAGVGLEYLMPNEIISIFGGYRITSRESNLSGLNYTDNSVSVGAKAAF